MTNEQLRQLLKEAFIAGQSYERTLDPYSKKPNYKSGPPSFTKWYNKKVKGKKLLWTQHDRMDALTEGIDDPHIETLIRMGR